VIFWRWAGVLLATSGLNLFATEIVWPTSLDRTTIHSPLDYLQATASGRPESGGFGMVREDGHRFHEGVDIRATARDKNGEPTDLIYSALDGQVAYLNKQANGGYGKYIVLFHPQAELPVYTLYGHLASIDPSLKVGDSINRSKVIGVMGHTSIGTEAIPRERAHLHFEIGVRLSDNFNTWYATEPEYRGVPNPHGLWHGQNLAGFNPQIVLTSSRINLLSALQNEPTALAVTIRTDHVPDFVKRHPSLVSGDAKKAAGWYVEFTWEGVPKKWLALPPQSLQLPQGRWSYVGLNYQLKDVLVQHKMITPDTKKAGETLIRQVSILLAGI